MSFFPESVITWVLRSAKHSPFLHRDFAWHFAGSVAHSSPEWKRFKTHWIFHPRQSASCALPPWKRRIKIGCLPAQYVPGIIQRTHQRTCGNFRLQVNCNMHIHSKKWQMFLNLQKYNGERKRESHPIDLQAQRRQSLHRAHGWNSKVS